MLWILRMQRRLGLSFLIYFISKILIWKTKAARWTSHPYLMRGRGVVHSEEVSRPWPGVFILSEVSKGNVLL